MSTSWQSLRFGWRLLRRNPGFTAVVIFTMALGIGANCTIFSVVNVMLLRALPFHNPDRLVAVWSVLNIGTDRGPIPYPDFLDLKSQSQTMEEMAAYKVYPLRLKAGGDPELVSGCQISEDFFPALGVRPVQGRLFISEEYHPGRNEVVILSFALWQKYFAGGAEALGQTVTLEGKPYTVVGVMPESFKLPGEYQPLRLNYDAALWIPLQVEPWEKRGNHTQFVVARLKTDATLEQAQAEATTIARRLEQEYPAQNKGIGLKVMSLHESLRGSNRQLLLLLFAAVGLVLLIASVNVANLQMACAAGREREIALRSALGADRKCLLVQLLTESVLLALPGGALGLGVAFAGCKIIDTALGNIVHGIPPVRIDGQVLGYALGITVLTGILFGLAPSIRLSQLKAGERLKEGGRDSSHSLAKSTFMNMLVISEVTLAVVLLISAGLILRSFVRLWGVNLGFQPARILTLSTSLSVQDYPRVMARVGALPGVQLIGATSSLPTEGAQVWDFQIHGRPARANVCYVSPQYFNTMGIPLMRGHPFSEHDMKDTPSVVVISEAMAHRYWGSQDPVGMQFNTYGKMKHTIVGVVGDVRQDALAEDARPQIYFALLQQEDQTMEYLAVRTQANPSRMISLIKREVQAIDPLQPISKIRAMETVLAQSVSDRHLVMIAMGAFAGIALILAVVGVYGVISYSTSRRTPEIGVRIALGARKGDVLRMVMGHGLRLVLAGIGLGIAIASAVTRILSSQLYTVTPTDPWTFAGVSLLLITAALLACYLPAHRASRVSPMVALKWE